MRKYQNGFGSVGNLWKSSSTGWLFVNFDSFKNNIFWKQYIFTLIFYISRFCDLPNAAIWACGFIVILAPIYVGYFLTVLGLLLAINVIIAAFFVMIELTLGLIFLMIGIWPAFIIAVSVTVITIVTLPQNMFYHALVTYRSVMLRRNLKILNFLLLPITHALVPPVTLIVALIAFFPWFAIESFIGFPTGPWRRIRKILNQVWRKFTKDVKKFADNYGHESGIPHDWDGTVYGLVVDPIVVIITIFVYIIGAIAMTPIIFVIFILKALPIFLETFIQFWKNINLMKAVIWYIGVLAGSRVSPRNQNTENNRTRSPAPGWMKCLKSAIKEINHDIEGYRKMKIFTIYRDILKGYFKSVKSLNLSKLGQPTSAYCKDLNPLNIIPKDIGCEIVLLWIPFLMVFLMWILGLVLVLTIPSLTFLLGFALWIIFWPIVIAAPPILYIGGWVLIIFGLPVFYVLLWCSIIISPWIFCIVGSIMGPILAFQIPVCMLTYNNYSPMNLWDNAGKSLVKGYKICRSMDIATTEFSFFKFRILCGDNISSGEDNASSRTRGEERRTIDYRNLFIQRCIEESRNIQRKKWITIDDILSVSPTFTIALPGVAIVAILEDTVKRNQQNNDKILIYWNEGNKCKHSNRDLTDNIANVFLPQLMKVKESMMALKKDDLDASSNWIKASLCDGEDEKTEELTSALEDVEAIGDIGKNKCLKIRASVENIVHALLRVREMNSRLSEIFNSAIKEDELGMVSIQNVVKDTEDVNPPDIQIQISGPPLSEGNFTFDSILFCN